MEMLGGTGIGNQCRKVDIMADAAYAILSKPVSFTGQFVIDEDFLKKEGVKDFDLYAVKPGKLKIRYFITILIFYLLIINVVICSHFLWN